MRGANHIADEGRDGHPFCHIDFVSDAGAWADVIPYLVNLRILPDMAAQCPLNPSEGCGDTIAPASLPMNLSTHDNLNTPEAQDDHA